jgi:hypothetical protein
MTFNQILSLVDKRIRQDVLPDLPIKDYKIKILNNNSKFLGQYKHHSVFYIPIIKINKREIQKAKTSLSLYDIILTTILHELAHAIQNLKGYFPYDEEQAENFAYMYWDWGIVETI